MYYELFDQDTSTSRTHFANSAGIYGINDLESRLEVIQGRWFFCTNRKRVYDFLLVLNSNLGPILPRFRDIRAFVRQKPILIPFPYSSQNYRVSPWSRSMMLESAKSEHPKLTSGEIIFVRIRTYVITIPQRHKQKNGRATIAIAIPRSV